MLVAACQTVLMIGWWRSSPFAIGPNRPNFVGGARALLSHIWMERNLQR